MPNPSIAKSIALFIFAEKYTKSYFFMIFELISISSPTARVAASVIAEGIIPCFIIFTNFF